MLTVHVALVSDTDSKQEITRVAAALDSPQNERLKAAIEAERNNKRARHRAAELLREEINALEITRFGLAASLSGTRPGAPP